LRKTAVHINKKLKLALPVLELLLKHAFGYKLCKIILYGSDAIGNNDSESDVDILIIINDRNLSGYNKLLSRIELELFNQFDLLFSIIPQGENFFLKNAALLPFFKNVSA
jgi:predicted nucleotidyltransferase